jgi:L1 cell adhesion molecule like protein
MTADNHSLGKFNLEGIPPAKRGVPQIEVTFDIDSNGILNVSAQDKSTGNTQSITITNEKGRLSDEEVDRLIKEAERHKDSDDKLKKTVELKNNLEQLCYQVKNTVQDEKLKDKITEDDKKIVTDAANETEQWLHTNQTATLEEYEQKKKELEDKFNPIMSKLYGQGQGMPGGPGGPGGPGFPGQDQGQQPGPEPTNINDID